MLKMHKNITVICFCSKSYKQYNYISHQIKYLQNKFRKYIIKTKIIDPLKNFETISQYCITSFPSYIFNKNNIFNKYAGTNINTLENHIQNLL